MAIKKSFVLRMDEEIYKALQKWASDEFRSVNSQIEWLICERLRDLNRLGKTGSPDKGEPRTRK